MLSFYGYSIWILILVSLDQALTLDVDLGGLVKQTVPGNEAVLHNCTSEQDLTLQQCYLNLFETYGMNYTHLPPSELDPFQKIRYDSTNMCTNYKTLRQCHSEILQDCLNFNAFNFILSSPNDAAYYVSQTAFLEFYCNYGMQFVTYYECMEQINLNDLADTIFTECSVLEVGSCDSVAQTTQCERAVVRKACHTKSAIQAYCSYQTILTVMTGWNRCEYMPCINTSSFLDSSKSAVFIVLFYLIYT